MPIESHITRYTHPHSSDVTVNDVYFDGVLVRTFNTPRQAHVRFWNKAATFCVEGCKDAPDHCGSCIR